MSKQSKHCMQNKLHSIARMSKQSIHCVQNKLDSMFWNASAHNFLNIQRIFNPKKVLEC